MGNLALNKSATASSCIIPFAANKAVDASITPVNRWVSSQVPAWLSVNLGARCWINRWVVRHMGVAGWASPAYNLSNFKFQISNDNVNWVDVDVINGNTSSVTDRTFMAVNAQFVRVYITNGININPKLASIVELEVYEAPPTSPYLLGLSLSNGTLQPAFVKNNYSYSTTVSNSITSITITPTAEDPAATIKVNGVVVASGTASAPINLNVGNNAIPVQVTSKIGGLVINYTVNVTRQKSVNLSNLTTSVGALSPAFNTDTTSYKVNVSYDTTSITVTPTSEDSTSAITVNSQAVTSGQPSQPINLNVGDNAVTVVVSVDGEQKTYSINVVRASSPYLTGLIIAGVMFAFNPNTFKYSKTLPNSKTTISFKPTAQDDNANIKIKYTEGGIDKEVSVISKQASPDIPLSVGLNIILIQVTSAIGQDQKVYEFDITRQS